MIPVFPEQQKKIFPSFSKVLFVSSKSCKKFYLFEIVPFSNQKADYNNNKPIKKFQKQTAKRENLSKYRLLFFPMKPSNN